MARSASVDPTQHRMMGEIGLSCTSYSVIQTGRRQAKDLLLASREAAELAFSRSQKPLSLCPASLFALPFPQPACISVNAWWRCGAACTCEALSGRQDALTGDRQGQVTTAHH